MSYFHQIKTVKDEEQMLKKIISIQTQIRARREKERLARNSQNEKYTKIFEPITRTLKDLSDIPTTSTTTTLHPNHAENLMDFKDPTNLIDVKDNPNLPPPSLIPEDSDIKYDIKTDYDDDDFLKPKYISTKDLLFLLYLLYLLCSCYLLLRREKL